ncbi:hypothetical protein E1A91_A12G024600v1, partial [Gossypium mustelinum]
YLALITRANKLSGFIDNLHACFANNVILNLPKSRKPKPQSHFDIHNSFCWHQCILLFVLLLRHQNLLIIPSNSRHKAIDNRKHCIAYIGIACKIDLINTSFSP